MPENNNNQNWLVRLLGSGFVKRVWQNFVKRITGK